MILVCASFTSILKQAFTIVHQRILFSFTSVDGNGVSQYTMQIRIIKFSWNRIRLKRQKSNCNILNHSINNTSKKLLTRYFVKLNQICTVAIYLLTGWTRKLNKQMTNIFDISIMHSKNNVKKLNWYSIIFSIKFFWL